MAGTETEIGCRMPDVRGWRMENKRKVFREQVSGIKYPASSIQHRVSGIEHPASVRRPFYALLAAAVAVVLLSACGPPPPVYIPQEYRTPAPPQGRGPGYGRQPGAAAPQPQTAPQGPVVSQAPEFKKQDISPAEEPPTPAPPPAPKTPAAEPPTPAPPPAPKTPAAEPPQHLASVQLVDQAKASLASGKPDAAIPVLERAIQADVFNGEAFLTLARAWKLKGSKRKALEFANKAELLFQEQPEKLRETLLFQAELYKEMGDEPKAAQYRQKASEVK
jgi:hypothetical protein